MWQNAWPALVLLALMVGLAWALKWARGRLPGLATLPGHSGPALRLLGSLSLGPQQRVVVLQVGQGEQARCLVLGVAPGGVNTLHEMALPAEPMATAPATPNAGGFAARLAQQLVKGPGDAPR